MWRLGLLVSLVIFAPVSAPPVEIRRVPEGGIQPQIQIDTAGTVHLLYFTGQPGSGDLYYARMPAGAADFTPSIRVNSEAGSAIATGTVRGGQLALGRSGWIHVAWNAAKPLPGEAKKMPMWYARLAPGATTFEPQRALGDHTKHLDGGGAIAADRTGRVHVVWHAAGNEDGEPYRRVYVMSSMDDGARFGAERAFAVDGGACGCCQLEATADASGRLHVLYRGARDGVHRDAMWLTIEAGKAGAPVRLQSWEINACPMTTFALAPFAGGIAAAWETDQQIYTAILNPDRRSISAPASSIGGAATSNAPRKHPAVAVNARGERLFAWTEGTAWARGGTFAWEIRNSRGERLDGRAGAGEVPVWSLVSAVARPDGSFLIVY